MAAALASTPSRPSRTSLGEPVEPLVESSSARSGCSVVRGLRGPPLATLRAGDDVGVAGLHEPRCGAGEETRTTWSAASAPTYSTTESTSLPGVRSTEPARPAYAAATASTRPARSA